MLMTRRSFLQQSAASAVAFTAAPFLLADPLGLPMAARRILSAPSSIRISPGR